MNDGGIALIGHHTAGNDLAVDDSLVTGNAHAAGGRGILGTQYGARVGTIGQTATDDGGLEIDAAIAVSKVAFRRIKGAAGDGHGSIAVVEDIGDACAAVVVSHAAAHHGGMEGAAIDGDAGAFGGGSKVTATGRLGVVAAHDQFVVVSFALRTKRTAVDGQGRLAGLQLGTGSAGDLAAAHHEFGGSGFFAADGGGDIAVRYGKELVIFSSQALGVAAADDLADGTAIDGEGDVALSISGSLRGVYQPAAHEVVNRRRLCTVVGIFPFQRHVIRSPGHTGAAHDQHTGHGQAAESVHQVALFEHRLVPVDQIADGSLGKLHATILHPWFYCPHVRMGRWRKSRLFRHSILKDRQPIK